MQVPQAHCEGSYPLGVKVATIRGHYRQGKLPAERANTLASLTGWTWENDRSRRRSREQVQLDLV